MPDTTADCTCVEPPEIDDSGVVLHAGYCLAADEGCDGFVPDAPRAPGLCANCGDSKAWHRPA